MFFLDFKRKITEKHLKLTKEVENGQKRVIQPAFGCAQHPKAGQTTQHSPLSRPVIVVFTFKYSQ